MKDNKKYWLNEFGLRRWQHKTLPFELQRSYHWIDNVSLLEHPTPTEPGRRYVGFCNFSTLEKFNMCSTDGVLSFNITDFEIEDIKYERRKKLEELMKKKHNKY